MRIFFRLHSFILIVVLGCVGRDRQQSDALFQMLSADHTGISFVNRIEENDSLNILNYEYMFNGGGVGILDVNNDGLSDIFFTGNQVANALYLNQGNLKFKDISQSAGVKLENTWCTGISVVDINSDGWDDLYISVGGPGNKSIFPNKLFINQGDLTFVEMADDYGLADPGESNQALFFDYDKDGDLDMYLLTGGGLERSAITVRPIQMEGQSRNTDQLYQNTYDSLKGHPVFTNVSKQAGITIEGYGLGVSVIDVNRDTWPDIYVSNDYLSRDLLYVNNQDGTFTDQSLKYFKHTSHFSMGNDVGDINNDGLMDIITVDMLPDDRVRKKLMFDPNQYDRFYQSVQLGYGYQYMRNMLHLNHGKGFSEIGQLAGISQTDWSWAPLIADFDNDGYQDVYITNGFGKDITDLDFVNFRREAFAPFANQMKMQKVFLDSINKRPPISVSNYIFKNEENFTFSDQSEKWGIKIPSISNGAAYADLDNDGDLEIIVNNINHEPFIFKNTTIEKNSPTGSYVRVKLIGPKHNQTGFETKVILYHNRKSQHRYHQVIRGFESSIENVLHFGLAADSVADSLEVIWPDGKVNLVSSPTINSTIEVDYQNSTSNSTNENVIINEYFQLISNSSISYLHKEIDFNDFRIQPSLLHKHSNQGPGIAVGDVNKDGKDDVFIGGAYGASGKIFIQITNSKFEEKSISGEEFEDLGAIFFDADGDSDLDLYVSSGGSERYPGHAGFQDRLYLNDRNGNFQINPNALPKILTSTGSVTAGDYDLDGDMDLFIGGRLTSTKYPQIPESYLLENRQGKFIDVTNEVSPELRSIGMVTSAIWTDFNNDHQPDLILAGEFMRITFLENQNGKLKDITDQTDLANSLGMWNSILPVDIDNDGDMDYVVGNIGLNTPFKVSTDNPLNVYHTDFDKNGTIDPIYSVSEDGKEYPFSSFDQLKAQIPILTKYIASYGQFAKMTTNDVLELFKNAEYETLSCTIQTSSIIENLGSNQFSIKDLPIEAQFAPVNGILAEDINLDGLQDLILVGNNYSPEVANGRFDASIGTVLLNQGNAEFKSEKHAGLKIDGNAKALVRMELGENKSLLLASQNNDSTDAYLMEFYHGMDRLFLKNDEVNALISMTNGKKRKVEFPIGGSYLSQSSASIVITPQIREIELFNYKGKMTRKMEFNSLAINNSVN